MRLIHETIFRGGGEDHLWVLNKRILGVAYLFAIALLFLGFVLFQIGSIVTSAGSFDFGSMIVSSTSLFLTFGLLAVSIWLYMSPLSDGSAYNVAIWGALGLAIPTILVVIAIAVNLTRDISTTELTIALVAPGVLGTLYGTATALETERKQVDSLYRRNQVLQRVFQHNIRNGMQVVLGYAQLLSDNTETQQQDLADNIEREARALIDLTDMARNLDELETTNGRKPVDIASVVTDLCDALSEYYPAASFDIESPSHVWVDGDDTLKVAVWHLLEFAIHRSRKTSVSVTVQDHENGVRLTVRDEGEELPNEVITALEKGKETHLVHPDGMDLWVVKWLFENIGGSMSVSRGERTGAKLSVTFDASTPEPAQENEK